MDNTKTYIVGITSYKSCCSSDVEVVMVNLTTIQVQEETRKKLVMKKMHPRESYDSVLQRMLESDEIPSMEDMFRRADSMKQKREYTTDEIVRLTHGLREKR